MLVPVPLSWMPVLESMVLVGISSSLVEICLRPTLLAAPFFYKAVKVRLEEMEMLLLEPPVRLKIPAS